MCCLIISPGGNAVWSFSRQGLHEEEAGLGWKNISRRFEVAVADSRPCTRAPSVGTPEWPGVVDLPRLGKAGRVRLPETLLL